MAKQSEENVFNKPFSELNSDEIKGAIDIYKMLVDMADKVSQRRQNANNFYLTVNTALIGATSYINSVSPHEPSTWIVSFAGLLVSLVWKRNIDSYKDLNGGKFHVITEIEKELPISPFRAEWDFLRRGQDKSRYRPFHAVEILVPYIFAVVHGAQIARVVPWRSVALYFCDIIR
ncbi:hypothetical protein GU700_17405 [Methylobacterium sp. NI91]|nr:MULTISPECIES: hypothetical protein [unclassified Methylobacterium]QIJ76210.1 hypothetical protein CLZ_17400 [Methylobacterium sp. CLZ]QIJ81115.1 hypothetical protein GU700_17405 [Methylobacterium sp. NI91]